MRSCSQWAEKYGKEQCWGDLLKLPSFMKLSDDVSSRVSLANRPGAYNVNVIQT